MIANATLWTFTRAPRRIDSPAWAASPVHDEIFVECRGAGAYLCRASVEPASTRARI
jgi:hypothetical protein